MEVGSVKAGQLVKIGDIVFKVIRRGRNSDGKRQMLYTYYYDDKGNKKHSSFDICLASALTGDDRPRYEKWLKEIKGRTSK